jgi:hypothetical protein
MNFLFNFVDYMLGGVHLGRSSYVSVENERRDIINPEIIWYKKPNSALDESHYLERVRDNPPKYKEVYVPKKESLREIFFKRYNVFSNVDNTETKIDSDVWRDFKSYSSLRILLEKESRRYIDDLSLDELVECLMKCIDKHIIKINVCDHYAYIDGGDADFVLAKDIADTTYIAMRIIYKNKTKNDFDSI